MPSRIPLILVALACGPQDAVFARLQDALGGPADEVTELLVGEPPVRSRRLRFRSGGELIMHDDALVAVLLNIALHADGPRIVDVSEWIPGATDASTLDELKQALGGRRRFSGFGTPYFELDGGFARADFRDRRGWNEPGNLERLVFTLEQPGLTCAPDDDRCPACSSLIRRGDKAVLDLDASIAALVEAVAVGVLVEDPSWVPLADLVPIHVSQLMERVESQLRCRSCRRVLCVALSNAAAPSIRYCAMNEARRHRLGAIPPVDAWGDAARIAAERDAMHYVDHEPGRWFLVEERGELLLDVRYVVSSMVDDTALISLSAKERADYAARGRSSLSELAERIHDQGPYRPTSPFHGRDLRKGPNADAYADAVSRAIVNHTWLARQRGA